mmetsp:Transcript_30566/g.79213  ORF Transcript_30566/g.79213 Transcript_30566/m.79213 type:complete len:254 (-) Transcript_30566:103-864(-)
MSSKCRLSNTVLEFGIGEGRFLKHHLQQGYCAIGVDAVPDVIFKVQNANQKLVTARKLHLVSAAIAAGPEDAQRMVPFYESHCGPSWNSMMRTVACRPCSSTWTATSCAVRPVKPQHCAHLLLRYGTPKFVRLDLGGGEEQCLAEMKESNIKPEMISVPGFSETYVAALAAAGYTKFRLVRQDSSDVPSTLGMGARDCDPHQDWRSLDSAEGGLRWLLDPEGQFDSSLACSQGARRLDTEEVGRVWYDVHASF